MQCPSKANQINKEDFPKQIQINLFIPMKIRHARFFVLFYSKVHRIVTGDLVIGHVTCDVVIGHVTCNVVIGHVTCIHVHV